ncbi:MAG: S1 family peptidase [Minwuia sp.]|uniref:S1 family peptidase n=1 Tax=Minwuia sp. TaxID=2493630 RepID=UPI003A846931
MSDTTLHQPARRIPAFTAWWIVSMLAAIALGIAVALLLTREPETVVRDVPSSETGAPTEAMLAEVARLDAEADAVSDETMETLRFVAAYECPPGTAPADAARLEDLKARARTLLARLGAAVTDVPPMEPERQPGRAAEPSPAAAALPAAPAAPATGPAQRRNAAQLSALLEKAVVFVLTTRNRQPVANGTGFFIAPDLVVTNRHVVEGSDLDAALLTSDALGDVVRARVIAASQASQAGGDDFAVLKTERAVAPGTLSLSAQHSKLMRVTAAGYPGLALGSDEGFIRLILGDRRSAPDMHQNSGEIRSIKEIGSTQSIVHTADVLSGYSGGPLVDMCGRVVGINTYIQVDTEQLSKLNSALGAENLLAFLNRRGYRASVQSTPCN